MTTQKKHTLGYICKYTPVEAFESMGVTMMRVEPHVVQFNRAETAMHPNVCSFVKGVYEWFSDAITQHPDLDGIVLTACCDSARRLCDALKERYPDKFFYLLDVPRKVNDFAVNLYENKLKDLLNAYADFAGLTLDETTLMQALSVPSDAEKSPKFDKNRLHIGILGARNNEAIIDLLHEHNVDVLFNMTCNSLERHFTPQPDFHAYAEALLSQFPCMRMMSATNRFDYLTGFEDQLDGIIYHTVQFCDVYGYEYADLKTREDLPILKIETDLTAQSAGQIKTRVEAFIEELQSKKGLPTQTRKIQDVNKMTYILGVDSGSTSTNAVIIDKDKNIVAYDVVRTGAKSLDSAEKIKTSVLAKAGLSEDDLTRIIATGYGRVSIPYADENITEISCHGKGAHAVDPAVRTILDIGGQDSKAIHLDADGNVTDFVMNDKCAAGTGRFLEMMARTLEVSLDELGEISQHSHEDITISSMCSVFAESEVISLIAQNKEKADIAHGVHRAIAGKAIGLLKRVGIEPRIMMTGGVAKNPGMVAVLEEMLGEKLVIADEPEIVGALGAAIFGLEQLK